MAACTNLLVPVTSCQDLIVSGISLILSTLNNSLIAGNNTTNLYCILSLHFLSCILKRYHIGERAEPYGRGKATLNFCSKGKHGGTHLAIILYNKADCC